MEYSLTISTEPTQLVTLCLNPYSNGILSDPWTALPQGKRFAVLILILMEYSLTNDRNGSEHSDKCLNPYSNGILSDPVPPVVNPSWKAS